MDMGGGANGYARTQLSTQVPSTGRALTGCGCISAAGSPLHPYDVPQSGADLESNEGGKAMDSNTKTVRTSLFARRVLPIVGIVTLTIALGACQTATQGASAPLR